MKSPSELEMVERDRMDLDSILKLSNDNCRSLIGHSGSVFGVSISPRRDFLVSGGEDGTVRLWSLMVYSGIIVHRGHLWPVWDVHFGPEFKFINPEIGTPTLGHLVHFQMFQTFLN